MLGKIDASLNKRLNEVRWGEYNIGNCCTVLKGRRKLSEEDLSLRGTIDVYSSNSANNGIVGKTEANADYTITQECPNYIVFGDHTRSMNIATSDFSVMDNVKVLIPHNHSLNFILFLCAVWKKNIPDLGYSRHWSIAKECKFLLPTKENKIDFDFIEEFIAELEERSVAELEERSVAELEAWLRAAGFENYNLTEGEQIALKEIDKLEYQIFNVKELFGKSTRGKRLKSADRVTGSLPFVTAGETDEGISAFIGNRITIFPANTTTIDMFGSAKYRNYEYGADDHIAVVHTQRLQEDAAIFVTSAIHKSSHNGQFDYGKNFYAKDADELHILLPTNGVVPDYSKMATIISAVKKLVIKDVAEYANKKIRVAQQVIAK